MVDISKLTPEQRRRLVGGRNRYHAKRRRQRDRRRLELVRLVMSGEFRHDDMSGLAERLGVSRTTIWKDMKAIESGEDARCVRCGQRLPSANDGT